MVLVLRRRILQVHGRLVHLQAFSLPALLVLKKARAERFHLKFAMYFSFVINRVVQRLNAIARRCTALEERLRNEALRLERRALVELDCAEFLQLRLRNLAENSDRKLVHHQLLVFFFCAQVVEPVHDAVVVGLGELRLADWAALHTVQAEAAALELARGHAGVELDVLQPRVVFAADQAFSKCHYKVR